MEHLGENAESPNFFNLSGNNQTLETSMKEFEQKFESFHKKDFVFGDVRLSNMLLVNNKISY